MLKKKKQLLSVALFNKIAKKEKEIMIKLDVFKKKKKTIKQNKKNKNLIKSNIYNFFNFKRLIF